MQRLLRLVALASAACAASISTPSSSLDAPRRLTAAEQAAGYSYAFDASHVWRSAPAQRLSYAEGLGSMGRRDGWLDPRPGNGSLLDVSGERLEEKGREDQGVSTAGGQASSRRGRGPRHGVLPLRQAAQRCVLSRHRGTAKAGTLHACASCSARDCWSIGLVMSPSAWHSSVVHAASAPDRDAALGRCSASPCSPCKLQSGFRRGQAEVGTDAPCPRLFCRSSRLPLLALRRHG
jgi:hypothetical protein